MSGGQQVCPREVQTLSVKMLTGESRKVCLLLWEQMEVPRHRLGSWYPSWIQAQEDPPDLHRR